jgi:hypothetical protein
LDDVRDFIDDVDDNDVEDDADVLEEDIEELRDDIDRTLNGTSFSNYDSNTLGLSTYTPSNSNIQNDITLDPLNFQVPPNTVAPVQADNWDGITFYAWTIGGIIILLAVIIFLIALLVA